jgi:hypothetical protein
MNMNKRFGVGLLSACLAASFVTTALPRTASAGGVTDEEMEKRLAEALADPAVLKLIQCYAMGMAVRDFFVKMQTVTPGSCLEGRKGVRGEPYLCGQATAVKDYTLFGLQGYTIQARPAFTCTECEPLTEKVDLCALDVHLTETFDVNLAMGFQGVVYNGSLNMGYKQKLEVQASLTGKEGKKAMLTAKLGPQGKDGPVEVVQSYQNVDFGYKVTKQWNVTIDAKGGSKLVSASAALNANQMSECAVSMNGGKFIGVEQVNRQCKDPYSTPFPVTPVERPDVCPIKPTTPTPTPTPPPGGPTPTPTPPPK